MSSITESWILRISEELVMTIIVTGGAGFIGSNFVFHMLKEHPDYRIICLDKLTYAGNLSTLKSVMDNPNFRFVKADICDREAVERLFEKEHPDIVVNFAAESHVDRSIENPEIFLQTNIIGTEVLMDACRKYGITRYHQVSTDEVYGDLPLDRPDLFFTEDTPIHTSSPYSSSKAGADLLVLSYVINAGMEREVDCRVGITGQINTVRRSDWDTRSKQITIYIFHRLFMQNLRDSTNWRCFNA